MALGLVFTAITSAPAVADTVLVAVAANFAAPARLLADRFETTSGHEVLLSAGSTGKLYAQVRQDAPFEVFLAADALHPRRLEDDGFAVPGSRFAYAIGRLVLWSSDPDVVDTDGNVLRQGRFDRLAIANPRFAPYGRAAREVLERLGLWDGIAPRLVRGENVSQAFQFVATGNAELGLVPLSLLREAGREGGAPRRSRHVSAPGSSWLVPDDLHQPIAQEAVLLRRGADDPAARLFLRSLRSPDGVAVIRSFGYEVPEEGPP